MKILKPDGVVLSQQGAVESALQLVERSLEELNHVEVFLKDARALLRNCTLDYTQAKEVE